MTGFETFDDYLVLLEVLVDTLMDRHQVGLKNALAYDRSVNFDNVDETLARQAWGHRCPTDEQKKATAQEFSFLKGAAVAAFHALQRATAGITMATTPKS